MIETLTLITLCVLYLVFFRPGKTPPLNQSLVIDRPGKYHVTLAPHLNLAQPFVEAIAQQLLDTAPRSGDSTTQFFEVSDKHVTSHGHETYLLAITQRDGILLFQAIAPAAGIEPVQTLSEFSHGVLARFPSSAEPDAAIADEIKDAAQQVANTRQIELSPLG